jgi:acetylornithine/N-succinyldiaminopimelate aminotransferase
MPTYGEKTLEFDHGKGVYLFSKDKKKYLDFGSGIAVNSLGHCHPLLIKTINEQSKKLWHTSNLYYSEEQEKYAQLLCNNSFAEKVFFTNSGAESIECGLKIVRNYFYFHKKFEKKNILTFEGAFHGRTFAALSAQQNKKYSKSFEPLLPGFIQVPFNNFNFLEKNVNESTSAILVETIQGEGGIRPVDLKFLEKIKNICIKKDLLMFLDEVQSGFGRSGKLFSYQWSNIKPDIMAVAKGIGSGFPMGACLATKKSSIGMTKGTHGSTFGGNPLAISIGTAVINEIMSEGFLEKVDKISRYLWNELLKLKEDFDEIVEVRGAGLLLGIKTKSKNTKINKFFEDNGLLTIVASDNIIRLAPPLIINKKDIDLAIKIIRYTLKNI